jgi:histidinol-phosphatase (PHP family)
MSFKEIFRQLRLDTHPMKMLAIDIMEEMAWDDFLVKVTDSSYKLADNTQVMEGTFHAKANGRNSILPDGSDIYKLPYRTAEEIDDMFRQHFLSMQALAAYGGFDILAHLDYPIRKLRGKIPNTSMLAYRDLIEPVLELLVQKNIALEINTRGTYDWQNRVGPEDWVLERYRELGGKYVTIGSDAHVTKYVGAGFTEAVAALKRTGFDSYTIYKDRCPVQIPLT